MITKPVFVYSIGISLLLKMVLISPVYPADLDCLIEPFEVVELSAPVAGIVEKIKVDRGDRVRKNQILALLESSLEESAVEIARTRAGMEAPIKRNRLRVEFTARQVENMEALFRDNLISDQKMDEARTENLLAKMDLALAVEEKILANLELMHARTALALRTVRSPVSGVVLERFVSPGEFVNQIPILKLAQINPLRIEVFAPISMLGKIVVGSKGQVMPEAPLEGIYDARVTAVDPVVDAASNTFGVRLELPNPKFGLPAGLKCKVRFIDK